MVDRVTIYDNLKESGLNLWDALSRSADKYFSSKSAFSPSQPFDMRYYVDGNYLPPLQDSVQRDVGNAVARGVLDTVTDPVGYMKNLYYGIADPAVSAYENTSASLPYYGNAALQRLRGDDNTEAMNIADEYLANALTSLGVLGLGVADVLPSGKVTGLLDKTNVFNRIPVSNDPATKGLLDDGPLRRWAEGHNGGPLLFENDLYDTVDPGGKVTGLLDNNPSNITMKSVYDARAEQMELPPAKRIQARENRKRILDDDYKTSSPQGVFDEDLSKNYPRNPDLTAKLPLGDRARILVDRRDEISTKLADKIKKSGQLDAATRYFYHSDGPIYRAAKNAGLSDEEASSYLKDFSQYFAATSPRTKVEENLRNATSAMAKNAAGIPHRQIVGPGSGGVSEKGYPMMTNPGGIHGQLLDQVIEGDGINVMTNTKPAMFGANMAGNRSGVTVDTHAIRGVLQTLNEIDPGAVPDGFILPKFRDAYRANPTTLTPDMINDSIGKQKIGRKGETVDAQTEYAVFADIFHDVAQKLNVDPAEAQSMAWFGLGGDTNLGSAPKTVSELFDERIDVTAQALNISPEETAKKVFRREIPLLGIAPIAGAGLLSAGMMRQEEQKPQQGILY